MHIPQKKIAVYIDGSNLYFKLKSLGIKNLSRFNYRKFIQYLAINKRIIYAGYYIGLVRAKDNDAKGQRLRKAQINLLNYLRSKTQLFTIRKGYLMENEGVYHEKGVDVQIAVDLLVGAYENLYDTAIVISSDTDLMPAMSKVKAQGKAVEYIGFGHEPSLAMQTCATISRLLIKEELKNF
ncbi:MAG: NYN domain-containing protein [Patescibacteria group bacterium]